MLRGRGDMERLRAGKGPLFVAGGHDLGGCRGWSEENADRLPAPCPAGNAIVLRSHERGMDRKRKE